MIYVRPTVSAPVGQGDIIDDCLVADIDSIRSDGAPNLVTDLVRVFVLTQTCGLAQGKVAKVVVALVLDAEQLVVEGQLKAADVRGPIRAGRVYGWYYLPKSTTLGLPESIVDLRSIYTVRLPLIEALCKAGNRRAHLQPLYREHLAQHFASTYSRIGLPMSYETD